MQYSLKHTIYKVQNCFFILYSAMYSVILSGILLSVSTMLRNQIDIWSCIFKREANSTSDLNQNHVEVADVQ